MEKETLTLKKFEKEDFYNLPLGAYFVRTVKNLSYFVVLKEVGDYRWFKKIGTKRIDLHSSGGEIRNTHINIGTGKDISIKDVALLAKKAAGYKGELVFNSDKPDGTLRKLTDVTKLHKLGWHHTIEIEEGIDRLYTWYVKSLLS